MKIINGTFPAINAIKALKYIKNERQPRKEKRRSDGEAILPFLDNFFENAGITGTANEKFCEIQYMIGQTLKDNVIPQIQAGGPVGPFTVTLDGETAFSYPKPDDFQYSLPGITGISYNSETISILNPNSTWASMSFTTENGGSTAFAATITDEEEKIIDSYNTLGFCYTIGTFSKNLMVTDLSVQGLNTVQLLPTENNCEYFILPGTSTSPSGEGVSGYFTDETEAVFDLEYFFDMSLDLSITAEMTTIGVENSSLKVASGYCGFDLKPCPPQNACTSDAIPLCDIQSVSAKISGENDTSFPLIVAIFVYANVTFRKDSVTIDNMSAYVESDEPLEVPEAYFSETGSCTLVGSAIPSETSKNVMIEVGIDMAIQGVMSMFNGWLNTQSYTIPL